MKKTAKTFTVFLMSIAAFAFSMNVSAANRTLGDAYQECGIGGAIFKNNRTMAAISNITWDLGTTAVSSNLSSDDSCNDSTASTAMFINESYSILEQDIAKGEGEHISALLDIVSCGDSANAISIVREDFSEIVTADDFAKASDFDKSEALFNIIHSNAVTSACAA